MEKVLMVIKATKEDVDLANEVMEIEDSFHGAFYFETNVLESRIKFSDETKAFVCVVNDNSPFLEVNILGENERPVACERFKEFLGEHCVEYNGKTYAVLIEQDDVSEGGFSC